MSIKGSWPPMSLRSQPSWVGRWDEARLVARGLRDGWVDLPQLRHLRNGAEMCPGPFHQIDRTTTGDSPVAVADRWPCLEPAESRSQGQEEEPILATTVGIRAGGREGCRHGDGAARTGGWVYPRCTSPGGHRRGVHRDCARVRQVDDCQVAVRCPCRRHVVVFEDVLRLVGRQFRAPSGGDQLVRGVRHQLPPRKRREQGAAG
jgi:hypothetical protein